MERVSASRAESMPIDSAIFAEQKSNQCVGAIAPTATRPCRVWQSVSFFRKIRSKVAAVPPLIFLKKLRFLKKLALCLDKEIARHSPRLRKKTQRVASEAQDCAKRPNGLQAKRSKKAALYLFRGWGERGEGKPFFLLRKQVMMRI